jgi:rhomboid protease GluP
MRRSLLVAVALLAPTVVLTGGRFAHPEVVVALRRDGAALVGGQWWRVLSPVLVQPDPPVIAVAVLALVAVAGLLAARVFGPGEVALLYLTGALVGEGAGYLWQPHGAGCSVAGCGWLGGVCAVWLGLKHPLARRVGAFWLLFALVDTGFRDIHGLPVLAGALLGWFFLRDRRRHPGPAS